MSGVSFVFIVNDPANLAQFMASLECQIYRDFEVILVTAQSPDVFIPLIERYHSVSVRIERCAHGRNRSRNIGLTASSKPIAAFPDEACCYSPQIVDNVVEFFYTSPDIDLLTGVAGDAKSKRWPRRPSGSLTSTACFVTEISRSLFVRREAALNVHGFDEVITDDVASFQDFLLTCFAHGHLGYFDRTLIVNCTPVRCGAHPFVSHGSGMEHVIRRHKLGPPFLVARSAEILAEAWLQVLEGDIEGARLRGGSVAQLLQAYMAPQNQNWL
jgi:hypothetical protein